MLDDGIFIRTTQPNSPVPGHSYWFDATSGPGTIKGWSGTVWIPLSAASATALAVQEADGSPNVGGVTTIIVPNGSMTDNGGGSVTIDPKAGNIYANIDGAGSAITTGVKGDLFIPLPITLTSAALIVDQAGTIQVDVWVGSFNALPNNGNSITSSTPPTVTNTIGSIDNSLTNWTTAITSGSRARFNVDSSTTVTRAQLILGFI